MPSAVAIDDVTQEYLQKIREGLERDGVTVGRAANTSIVRTLVKEMAIRGVRVDGKVYGPYTDEITPSPFGDG